MVLVTTAIATLHKLRMSKRKEGEQKYCPITLVDYDGPNANRLVNGEEIQQMQVIL